MSKFLVWGGIAFAVYYFIKDPVDAGNLLHGALRFVEGAANSLSTAVNHVGGNQ